MAVNFLDSQENFRIKYPDRNHNTLIISFFLFFFFVLVPNKKIVKPENVIVPIPRTG